MTDLEFALAWKADRALKLLVDHHYLSELGQSQLDELGNRIDSARASWDPEITGPSSVHALAQELISDGFIGRIGLAAHAEGPKPIMSQLDQFGVQIDSGS